MPDVDNLKQRLQGFDKISEAVFDGKIYMSTYSIPVDPTLKKRGTALEKREVNLEKAHCWTACVKKNWPQPNPDDCIDLYNNLYSMNGQFSVSPRTSRLPSQLTPDRQTLGWI